MNERNLSPSEMFVCLARDHVPHHSFAAHRGGFKDWKKRALPEVLHTLGAWPQRVDPRPEITGEWQTDGLLKHQYQIDVGPHISAALQVNFPAERTSGKKYPAILCWHGHGPYGKDPVMGNDGNPGVREAILASNYDYGRVMAQRGFITFAIDWIGGGERSDRLNPHFSEKAGMRDWCNLYYLNATMLGMTSLSINLAHGMAATDVVCAMPEVDPARLGVMGLSGGGTMTLWSALTDSRFRAAEIICYSGLWSGLGMRDLNYCGMQVSPGLYQKVDLPDLQGLLAPLPLLIDIGTHDSCFTADEALACHRQVEKIYAAAGVSDRLELDLFPGEHGWGGNRSEAFFRRYLQSEAIPNRERVA